MTLRQQTARVLAVVLTMTALYVAAILSWAVVIWGEWGLVWGSAIGMIGAPLMAWLLVPWVRAQDEEFDAR